MTSWGWFPRSKATVAKPVFGKKDRAVFLSPCQQCLNVGVEGSDFLCNELLCRRHVSSLPYPLPYPSVLFPAPPPFSLSFFPHHSLFLTLLPCSPLGVFLNISLLWDSYRFYLRVAEKAVVRLPSERWTAAKQDGLGPEGDAAVPVGEGRSQAAPPTPHPPVFLNWALLEGSQCLLGASLGLLGALLGFLERGGHESTTSKYGFS